MCAKFLPEIQNEINKLMSMLKEEVTVDQRMTDIMNKAKSLQKKSTRINELIFEIEDIEVKKQSCIDKLSGQIIPNKQLNYLVEIYEIRRKFDYLRLEAYLMDLSDEQLQQKLDYYTRMEKLSIQASKMEESGASLDQPSQLANDTFLAKIESALAKRKLSEENDRKLNNKFIN